MFVIAAAVVATSGVPPNASISFSTASFAAMMASSDASASSAFERVRAQRSWSSIYQASSIGSCTATAPLIPLTTLISYIFDFKT